jgi:mannosyltransferase OCH1-like enzyme
MIPKKLHFCWFGPKPVPDDVKRCLDTWREHMPDFEIVRWGNNDLPMNSYLETAVAHAKWANVSNYVRFHALHAQGGIYLDTDIEVVKSFEPLLGTGVFAGWQRNGQVNNAVLGARPKHPFIERCMKEFVKRFGGVEEANRSSPFFITAMLIEAGHITKRNADTFVEAGEDITVYPERFFYPHWHTETLDRAKHITPDTYCIHHWAATWK